MLGDHSKTLLGAPVGFPSGGDSTADKVSQTKRLVEMLRSLADVHHQMLIVGGGGTSRFWRQMFADMFAMEIVKSNVDQDAAALGAAAIAAVGSGLWSDFEPLDRIHRIEDRSTPQKDNSKCYEDRLKQFDLVSKTQADLATMREM